MKTEVRSQTMRLSAPMRQFALDKSLLAFSRFADRVHSVVVRVDDVNGPRGGVDKVARVRIRGPKLSLVLHQRSEDAYEAIARVLRRAGHTLSRRLDAQAAVR